MEWLVVHGVDRAPKSWGHRGSVSVRPGNLSHHQTSWPIPEELTASVLPPQWAVFPIPVRWDGWNQISEDTPSTNIHDLKALRREPALL